jgi:hypothetical protein
MPKSVLDLSRWKSVGYKTVIFQQKSGFAGFSAADTMFFL